MICFFLNNVNLHQLLSGSLFSAGSLSVGVPHQKRSYFVGGGSRPDHL